MPAMATRPEPMGERATMMKLKPSARTTPTPRTVPTTPTAERRGPVGGPTAARSPWLPTEVEREAGVVDGVVDGFGDGGRRTGRGSGDGCRPAGSGVAGSGAGVGVRPRSGSGWPGPQWAADAAALAAAADLVAGLEGGGAPARLAAVEVGAANGARLVSIELVETTTDGLASGTTAPVAISPTVVVVIELGGITARAGAGRFAVDRP